MLLFASILSHVYNKSGGIRSKTQLYYQSLIFNSKPGGERERGSLVTPAKLLEMLWPVLEGTTGDGDVVRAGWREA